MLAFVLLVLSAFAGIVEVEILDIGQGDAILIRSPEGKTVLIDGGTGKVDVVDYLRARGVEEINMMVGTHAHADHIGGLDEVIEAFPVKVYVDNELPHTTRTYEKVMDLIEKKGIRYLPAKNGQTFNLGKEVVLEVIHPQITPLKNTRSDLNSNSVVIRMTHGKNCFLFTGDAEEPTEHTLVQKGIEPCDVLKVAHHGSDHSSTNEFLNAVQPEIAVISLGLNNRYGHPGEDTMKRLERTGAQIYRTDTQGTIKLSSDGKKITVSTEGKDGTPTKKNVTVDVSDNTYKKQPTEHSSTDKSGKFDLNKATSSQLESIPGIGPSKAAAILSDIEKNGPFSSISDVQRVSGIGVKTAEKIAQYAFVSQ